MKFTILKSLLITTALISGISLVQLAQAEPTHVVHKQGCVFCDILQGKSPATKIAEKMMS